MYAVDLQLLLDESSQLCIQHCQGVTHCMLLKELLEACMQYTEKAAVSHAKAQLQQALNTGVCILKLVKCTAAMLVAGR